MDPVGFLGLTPLPGRTEAPCKVGESLSGTLKLFSCNLVKAAKKGYPDKRHTRWRMSTS